ncbi:MAG: polysaccharide deacetylase family protein [Pseudomonadales bacterium]
MGLRESTRLRARRWLLFCVTVLALGPAAAQPTVSGNRETAAVVLLYHHVDGTTPASTSVAPDLFEAHLAYLADQGYQVLPLGRIIEALRARRPLPEKAVAITFDDAYRSVYAEAAPRLEARGWPYTIFVSTDYLDGDYGGYLTWAQLRALTERGAEVGNHSRSHAHYVFRAPTESPSAWAARIRADVSWARQRLADELGGAVLPALAYPYGEFSAEVEALTADLDLVGLGQQSGPIGWNTPLTALPRFPMAGSFADLGSLAEKLRTRPLDPELLSPRSSILAADAAAPALRLAFDRPGARLTELRCYVSGQAPATITWLDGAKRVAEIRAQAPLPAGRSKFNCTAPARDAAGVYYWYSHLWMKAPAPGRWYRD